MTLAPFADLESRIADVTSSRLANAYVVLSTGQAFGAELNQADEVSFDAVASGSEQLVYRSSHSLQDDELISINGHEYRVVGAPRRQDEHFSRAEVIRL
ncbi:hypothetical protein [Thauera propionica]|uniref:hypothetical protein n=1 Tax=Thauera propionica TaxID=2019431 RepID=UPI0023F0549B|nr:hypothetical protein [Thauera propionica]MDD3675888.1 hypothetical protein [Thauera propionica]